MFKNSKTIACIGLIAFIALYSVIYYNAMIGLQEQIRAKYDDNQQIYSTLGIKIEQSGLTADRYADQVVRSIEVALDKRYGKDGIQSNMVWIQESNPEIDAAVYKKLQQVIESEFTDFASNQRTLIDLGRTYRKKLRGFPSTVLAKQFGFSEADITEYMTVLKTDDAQRDFNSGKMTTPELFKNKTQDDDSSF